MLHKMIELWRLGQRQLPPSKQFAGSSPNSLAVLQAVLLAVAAGSSSPSAAVAAALVDTDTIAVAALAAAGTKAESTGQAVAAELGHQSMMAVKQCKVGIAGMRAAAGGCSGMPADSEPDRTEWMGVRWCKPVAVVAGPVCTEWWA